MSWREGSSPPTMWRAVRTTLCRALQWPAVLFPNQVIQPVRMLSTVQVQKDLRILGLVPYFLSLLGKKRRRCAFFSTASVWADHVRSSVMWKHRFHLLSYRSRGTLMSYTDHSVWRHLKSNTPHVRTQAEKSQSEGFSICTSPLFTMDLL